MTCVLCDSPKVTTVKPLFYFIYWRDANIDTIYKNKGNKTICRNHWSILQLAVASKVLAKIMLHRPINDITESLLPESQCGFRRNRSTADMVFTTRHLRKKCRMQHWDLFMAFFDRFWHWRDLLCDILLQVGCSNKFMDIFREFHDGMNARVTKGGQESASFPLCTGVRQRCVPGPEYLPHFHPSAQLLINNCLLYHL